MGWWKQEQGLDAFSTKMSSSRGATELAAKALGCDGKGQDVKRERRAQG